MFAKQARSRDGTYMLRPILKLPAYHVPQSTHLCLIGISFHYEQNILIWTYNKSARKSALGAERSTRLCIRLVAMCGFEMPIGAGQQNVSFRANAEKLENSTAFIEF